MITNLNIIEFSDCFKIKVGFDFNHNKIFKLILPENTL